MLRFYGVDLETAFFGDPPMQLRRLLGLIRGLPADAATWRELMTAEDERGSDDVAPARGERVVKSLTGVNLASLIAGTG